MADGTVVGGVLLVGFALDGGGERLNGLGIAAQRHVAYTDVVAQAIKLVRVVHAGIERLQRGGIIPGAHAADADVVAGGDAVGLVLAAGLKLRCSLLEAFQVHQVGAHAEGSLGLVAAGSLGVGAVRLQCLVSLARLSIELGQRLVHARVTGKLDVLLQALDGFRIGCGVGVHLGLDQPSLAQRRLDADGLVQLLQGLRVIALHGVDAADFQMDVGAQFGVRGLVAVAQRGRQVFHRLRVVLAPDVVHGQRIVSIQLLGIRSLRQNGSRHHHRQR